MLRELAAGVIDGVRGAAYVLSHRRLWKLVIAPTVVVAVIAAVTLGWLVGLLGAAHVVRWASLGVASATVIVTFAALVTGPFDEMISETIEQAETGKPPPRWSLVRFSYELAVGIAHAARRGAGYLASVVAVLAIGWLIPVVGPPLAAAASVWVTARFAAYDVYDAIWARRHWRYRDKTAYLRAHRWRTLGLGAVVAVTFWVPGLNVLGLAIGTAGATLHVLADERG